MIRGVVVTGTDTGVGKTLVSALLLAAVRLKDPDRARRYWKPVQTGSPPDDDAATVVRLAQLTPAELLPGAVRLRLPASPFEAARAAGVRPVLPAALPQMPHGAALVVEGAGGILVPFDERTTLADAFASWGLPLLVVARPDVGTLNHTLLTIEAARARGLEVVGVAVSRLPTAAVLEAIETHGRVRVAVIPPVVVNPAGVERAARTLLGDARFAGLLDRVVAGPSRAVSVGSAVERGDAVEGGDDVPANALAVRDAAVVWHPYTQHGLRRPPLAVERAQGAWLSLADGRRVIDGISSWWTGLHGHGHPAIARAVAEQARALDHVQFGGATHEPAVALAERLVALAPRGLARVFYSDDGSTAVESALKMAIAFHARRGDPRRTKIVALEQAYHGDTAGAMSVSADGPFTADFHPFRFDVLRTPAPVDGVDPAACVAALRALLDRDGERVAAMIVEPLVLAAAGMRVYDDAFLRAVRELTDRRGVLLVADEVFTGFGRTGARFACERAGIAPDLLCLSKALTGGTLPLAATIATEAVFDAFRSERLDRAFLHGHSYTANPIACAAANASLDLLDDAALERGRAIGERMRAGLLPLRAHPHVRDVRGIGLVAAVEVDAGPPGYLSTASRRMADAALEHGVLLRPLGDVVYAMPPLCVTDAEVDRIVLAVRAAVEAGARRDGA